MVQLGAVSSRVKMMLYLVQEGWPKGGGIGDYGGGSLEQPRRGLGGRRLGGRRAGLPLRE